MKNFIYKINKYQKTIKNMKRIFLLIVLISQIAKSQTLISKEAKDAFPLVSDEKAADIYFDTNDFIVVGIAANHLSKDIYSVTGKLSKITSSYQELGKYSVIIGTVGQSKLIDQLIREKKIDTANLVSKWEAHSIQVIKDPLGKVKKALVIVGSDRRGTAYGVFELSEQIGVSPWYWWADVPPKKKEHIFIKDGIYKYGSPSVKYRGIFLNDEDAGLKLWAAETFDPVQNDIGPKTYSKVCELLLRLKANYLWPAMHGCTAAFNQIPGNKLVADSFAIIMGSTHCEPLLFNNASEWDTKTMGEWNYQTNKQNIYNVLDKRVKENSKYENVYTIAMRGLHDTAMIGALTMKEKIQTLENAVADQREILSNNISKDIEEIPQIFIPYKEVLEVYENGLNLPDDITIVWPDDNFGYIKRLSNHEEQKRLGRSGVYYHISVLNNPHEYLWLNTTPPALIFEEMKKAYDTGADRIWIVNVGDLKPGEYGMEFFLDLAWDMHIVDYENTNQHLENWLGNIFGENYKKELAEIMQSYYRLGFIRKPEYMSWGYIWDINYLKFKKTYDTEFSFINYREADERIKEYNKISEQVKHIYQALDPNLKPSFYQLVYYPVVGASLMNKIFLYAQKNHWYARQTRAKTNGLISLIKMQYDSLRIITMEYNQLLDGKWNKMMTVFQNFESLFNITFKDGKLTGTLKKWEPVFFEIPRLDTIKLKSGADPALFVEEENNAQGINNYHFLPCFNSFYEKSYFIDIYNKGDQSFTWEARPGAQWITLSKTTGTVTDEERIWVSVDYTKAPTGNDIKGEIVFSANGKSDKVLVSVFNPDQKKGDMKGLFVENNGYIVISPNHFNKKKEDGRVKLIPFPNLGITDSSVVSIPPTTKSYEFYDGTQPYLEYDFFTNQTGKFVINTMTLPTFALNKQSDTRYGISVDDELPQLGVAGSPDEWKGKWAENVLRNTSMNYTIHTIDKPGKHTLKFWVIDPGIVLQKIVIDFGGLKPSYMGPNETKINVQ